MEKDSRIYVGGHRGMVGSAIVRALERGGHARPVLRTSRELDLRDEDGTRRFFAEVRPEYVFLAAARVGGILENSRFPVEFLIDNLRIQNNVIQFAHEYGVKKLLFLGSSCIYPKFGAQPLREDALMTGVLEPTNEAYAVAKIAGLKLCQFYAQQYGDGFISAMPTNLYGANDNYDLESSHVLPALLRRFHVAKAKGHSSIVLWGTGSPRREFLHADDLAEACLFLMRRYDGPEPINIGTGADLPICALAEIVREIVGFEGEIEWDPGKPDGTPRKLLDVSRIHALGWRHRIPLKEGICEVYKDVDKSGWLLPPRQIESIHVP